MGWLALLRTSAVGVATALGIVLFPDHAIWPALTVLLVMRPKAGEALEAGLLRTIGTLAGALTAEAIVAIADGSEVVVFAAFMLAAFAMVALRQVNHALFVVFLTAAIVLSEALTARVSSQRPCSVSSPSSLVPASPSSASALAM